MSIVTPWIDWAWESAHAATAWFMDQPPLAQAEHVVVALVGVWLLRKIVSLRIDDLINIVPGVKGLISSTIEGEVEDALRGLLPNTGLPKITTFPKKGKSPRKILSDMEKLRKFDPSAADGKAWAYMYETMEEDHETLVEEAYTMFMQENALNPIAFPALRQMEVEVCTMTIDMLNGTDECVGSMTSGGTESILCAIKAYRERARELHPHIKNPEIVLPITAHPAFGKAGHLFDVKMVHTAMGNGMRADVAAMEAAINGNTIALVGSAFQYPHGVVDPIPEIAALAERHGLPLHVDACIGGFILPWVEKLGYQMPVWDFRIPAVTSISADVHKYGFAAKGASCISWRNAGFRKHQMYARTDWPGGLFVSPSLLGSRPGGAIAAAWASLTHLGEDGFLRLARVMMDTAEQIMACVEDIDGLELVTQPDANIVSVLSTDAKVNILAVADVMEDDFGWKMERNMGPDSIHMSVMPAHSASVDQYCEDLRAAVHKVKTTPDLNTKGTAAMYGMVANIPSGAIVEDFLLTLMNKVYTTTPVKSKDDDE